MIKPSLSLYLNSQNKTYSNLILHLTKSLNMPPDPAPLDVRTHSELADEAVISINSGMNQVGKSLARELKVHLSQEVTEIVPSDGNRRWKIVAEDAVVIDDYDWVFITTPPHQAAEILRMRDSAVVTALNAIEPEGCWSLMLVTEPALPLNLVSNPGNEII